MKGLGGGTTAIYFEPDLRGGHKHVMVKQEKGASGRCCEEIEKKTNCVIIFDQLFLPEDWGGAWWWKNEVHKLFLLWNKLKSL